MTKIKLIEYFGKLLVLAAGIVAFWYWSSHQVEKSVVAECALRHQKQEMAIIEVKQQEAKNVEVKKSAIYSKPNAGRDSLLDKMRAGQL